MITKIDTACAKAALRLLARQSWASLDIPALAKAAKQPLPLVKKRFPRKEELLPAIVAYIDSLMRKGCKAISKESSLDDRLFEIMMARFDALQAHRAAILELADQCRKTPTLALIMYRAQMKSMSAIFALTQLQAEKTNDTLRTLLLLGLYHFVFLRWQQDSTPDLSRTMAALNDSIQTCKSPHLFA